MDAREGKFCFGELNFAVFFVGITGGHEEGCVDFEAPGATLNGTRGWEFGEVAVVGWSVAEMEVNVKEGM